MPCKYGPDQLRKIDQDRDHLITFSYADTGQPMSFETLAEMYIADCSDQIARLSAFAAMQPENDVARGVVAAWKTNLEYMQWWLKNRRDKAPARH